MDGIADLGWRDCLTIKEALDIPMTPAHQQRGMLSLSTWGASSPLLRLVRFRYHILTHIGSETRQLLAEDCQTLAFEGAPDNATWIDSATAETLMNMEQPDENIDPIQAADFVNRVTESFTHLAPQLEAMANQRSAELLVAHRQPCTRPAL